MENTIKVSVIVPVYNAESYIQATMEMLCRSTLKEIEIVAVNDGSTDNSLKVLQECAAKDSRIKVYDKPNGGIFDARNRGLAEAHGEYICFCDQDDVVEEQMYERMHSEAVEKNADVVLCSTGKVDDKGRKVVFRELKDTILLEEKIREQSFLPLVFNRFNVYTHTKFSHVSNFVWKCMIKSDLVMNNELRFRRYVNYEDDRLFLLDVLARAEKVVYISECLYYWKVNSFSESHTLKYISEFYRKDVMFQDATIEIMVIANVDEKYKELFARSNSALRYTRLLENEIAHMNYPLKEKLREIKRIYQEQNFAENVKASKYFPKNMFARKIVCFFLMYHLTLLAYLFFIIYIIIRHKCQNKGFWIGLEKKIMKG